MSARTPSDETTARQRRASDPAASAWVSANAGSGKTYVLAQRVIRLLLAGAPPGRILCLTFTKAAAANMANRVFGWLAEWTQASDAELDKRLEALGEPKPDIIRRAVARRLFAQALETPGGLKILTIHGFCERVLQQFPFEAGVTPRFSVLDDRGAAELIAQARAEAVMEATRAPDGPLGRAMTAVIGAASDSAFDEALTEILKARGPLARAMTQADGVGAAGLIPGIAAALGVAPDARLEDADAEVLAGGFPPSRWLDLAAAFDTGAKTDQGCAATLREAHGAKGGAARDETVRRALYRSLFFTQKGDPRARLGTKGFREAFPAIAEELDSEMARLVALAERRRAIAALTRTGGLLTFADAVMRNYIRAKAARGALDFDDLVARTRGLFLRIPSSWAHYKLDEGIDHVLVDEAQDTNPDQWDIVASLTSEFTAGLGARGQRRRTVFAVGDEKQSIYGFQGAAPEAFDTWRRHYGQRHAEAGLAFSDVRLIQSFRSTEDVIGAVDRVFSRPEAYEGLEAQSAATVHETVRTGQAGLVEVWPLARAEPAVTAESAWDAPFDSARATSQHVMLAERIARAVSRWTVTGDAETGRPPVSPGDVLILVRSRGRLFEATLRALKQAGVPVAGADRLVLGQHIAVMDLLALGDAMTTPDDDLALASVLKSPLFGLDDDDLMAVAPGRAGRLEDALVDVAGERGPFFASSGQAGLSARPILRDAAFSGPQDEDVGVAQVGKGSAHTHHPHPEETRRVVSKDGPRVQRLAAAHARLTLWRGEARRLAPADFYMRVLGRDEGRKAFRARLGAEADDVLDEFLGQALAFGREGIPTLAGFLHWMRAAEVEIKRDLDVSSGEVRVMTVHGAKGLEAKTVILADIGDPPKGGQDGKVLTLPATVNRPALPVWSPSQGDDPPPVAEARLAARVRAEAEHRRLLYVALTRAEDHLVVAGALPGNVKDVNPKSWHAMVREGLAPHARAVEVEELGGTVLRFRVTEGDAATPDEKPAHDARAPAARPLWAARRLAPEPLPRAVSPSTALGHVHRPVAGPATATDPDRALRRGVWIHRLAERLPLVAPGERETTALRYLAAEAAAGAVEGAAGFTSEVAAEALALVADPALAALFGSSSRAEVSIAGTLEISGASHMISGRIDRLVEEPGGGLLLVDLKTDRTPGSPPPDAYLAQLALYRALLRKMKPNQEVTAAILWTALPRLDRITPDALDAALARMAAIP